MIILHRKSADDWGGIQIAGIDQATDTNGAQNDIEMIKTYFDSFRNYYDLFVGSSRFLEKKLCLQPNCIPQRSNIDA